MIEVIYGDCLEELYKLPDCSVDSVITDPPYEIGFMNKKWDGSGIAYNVGLWQECLRVLKPGGYLLSFGGTRTWHRLAVAVETAGFEIRDSIAWMYSSGFPKSHNLKDKWDGWGTALKPAFEPIIVARKPFKKTVAGNVSEWGTGALNIDGSRIGDEQITINTFDNGAKPFGGAVGEPYTSKTVVGRWPANVILDESTAEMLDEQSGVSVSRPFKSGGYVGSSTAMSGSRVKANGSPYDDEGGASRFFYVSKANKKERPTVDGKGHPTVKPLSLMRYLCKLVTPPSGTVLDPFAGSGATVEAAILEGFNIVAIEKELEYISLIEQRIERVSDV